MPMLDKRVGLIMMLVIAVLSMATLRVDASSNDAIRSSFRVWSNETTGSSTDETTDLPKSKSSSASQSSTGSLTGSKATITNKPSTISQLVNHSAALGSKKNGSSIGGTRKPLTKQPTSTPFNASTGTIRPTTSPTNRGSKQSVSNPTMGSQQQQDTTSANALTQRNTAVILGVVLTWIGALVFVLVFAKLLRRHLGAKENKLDTMEEASSESPTIFEDCTSPHPVSSFWSMEEASEPMLQCSNAENHLSNCPQVDMNSLVGSFRFEEEHCDTIETWNRSNLAASCYSDSSHSSVNNLASVMVCKTSFNSPTSFDDEATTPRHSSSVKIVRELGSKPILQCDVERHMSNLQLDRNSVMGSMPLEKEFCDAVDDGAMKNSAVRSSHRSRISWNTTPSVDSDSTLPSSSHSLLGRNSVSTTDSKTSRSLEDPSSVGSDPIQSPTWTLLI